jgi:cytochrome c-type biogenesis protein CcmH
MMAFVIIAAVMVAVALAWLLLPLLRGHATRDVDRAGLTLGILKDQLADLERERAAGHVGAEQYAETKAELERRVLEEVHGREAVRAVTAGPRGPRLVPWLVVWCVPVAAGLLYYRLGDPQAFNPLIAQAGADHAHALGPDQLEAMASALESRLRRDPDNADGWSTLARTYYSMGRFPDAVRAFARLVELVPEEASVLADYADAMAMSQGRNIEGRPLELVNRALKLDPTQWKALAMAGTAAFNRKDYKGAVEYWERLQRTLPPETPIAQQIGASIAEARSLAGLPPAPALAQASPAGRPPLPADHPPIAGRSGAADKGAAGQASAAPGKAAVGGTVTLGAALKAKAAPTDTVIIFARPAQGSRMPLAITSVQVKDLPAKFTLDETMAMSPEMTLATVQEVIVGARVSKSGRPMPSSGDFEGLSKPVKVGTRDIAVTIDTVLP